MPGAVPRGRPRAHSPSVQRDGFAWPAAGIGARLHDHLYTVVPSGLRRQQMMRYMLLGFMADTGLKPSRTDFVPPVPVEVALAAASRSADTAAPEAGVPPRPAGESARRGQAGAAPAPAADGTDRPDPADGGAAVAGRVRAGPGAIKPGVFAGFRG